MSTKNPVIAARGDRPQVINYEQFIQMKQPPVSTEDMVGVATTGVNELRAVTASAQAQTPKVDLNKITEKASKVIDEWQKTLGQKVAKEGDSKNDFFGNRPNEKYDENVRSDEEKRVKDNLRDESKIERPYDFDKLKSFAKLKANLILKAKKVQSLLEQVKERNHRNRLHYLQASIENALQKMATLENGDWANPKSKNEKDTDKATEQFFSKENTKPQINDLNNLLQKAQMQNLPEEIRKKAEEVLSKEQRVNVEQAISELEKSDVEYGKDIIALQNVLGKEAKVTKAADEKEEKGEKEDKEEKDEKGEKEDDKEDKKEDGKDKKAPAGKDKKKEMIERMKKMREMKGKNKPAEKGKEEAEKDEKGEKPEMDGGEKKPMPFKPVIKDDLTAEFTRMPAKVASYWEVKDGENKTILKFTAAEAMGKEIFKGKVWNDFSSTAYGNELLSRIRTMGLKAVAGLLKVKCTMTKHASMIEAKLNKKASLAEELNGAKYVKHDENTGLLFVWHGGQGVNIYDESGSAVDYFTIGGANAPTDASIVEEAIEDHIKYMLESQASSKNKLQKQAAAADPKKYFRDVASKAETPEAKKYFNEIANLFGKNKKSASVVKETVSFIKEKREMEQKIAELENKLSGVDQQKQNLETEKVLRAKAERALVLATKMLDKKMIAADKLEENVEKLVLMDDISFAMMVDMIDKTKTAAEAVEKKFVQTAGLKKAPPVMLSEPSTLKDRLSSMFMGKYAKLEREMAEIKK